MSRPEHRTDGPPPLRLPTGSVTALLGPALGRARVITGLDETTARTTAGSTGGPTASRAVRVGPGCGSVDDRVAQVDAAIASGVGLLLADHLGAGLDAVGRREVLRGLRRAATAGAAVLVDDTDPVAVLAVADQALRVGRDGSLALDALAFPEAVGS